MHTSTYFDQDCPICGRRLQIRVAYLGRRLACQHCRGEFEACNPGSTAYPPDDSGLALLRRAGELLGSVNDDHSPD